MIVLLINVVTFVVCGNAVASSSQKSEGGEVSGGTFDFSLLIGSLHINSPIKTEEDIELNVIPKFSYYGEKFYLENTTLGYSFVENEKWIFDLTSEFNLDGTYFHTNNDALNTFLDFLPAMTIIPVAWGAEIPYIEDRDYSYMMGFSGSWQFDPGSSLHYKITHDITGVHQGNEAQFSISHSANKESLSYRFELGVYLKDKKLSNYYYGLRDSEIIAGSYEPYTIDSYTINPYFSVLLEKQFSQNCSLYFSYKSIEFDTKISDSILVSDDEVNIRFVGIRYQF